MTRPLPPKAVLFVSLLGVALSTGCADSGDPDHGAQAEPGGSAGTAPATGGDASGGTTGAGGDEATSAPGSHESGEPGESGESGEPGESGESGGDTSSTGADAGETGGSTGGAGESSTGGEPPDVAACEAPGDRQACDGDGASPFEAMGLGCALPADQAVPIFDTVWSAADPDSWRVARQFGNGIDPNTGAPYWSAREGEQFLILSTGRLAQPDENGTVLGTAGVHEGGVDNGNPNLRQLPAPMTYVRGSNGGAGGTPFLGCDAVGDCSDSLYAEWVQGGEDAHDLLWFQFSTPVPGGTHGFSFDFAYFSAEFPEFVDTSFNDVFAVWSDSEGYTGNLCFVADRPCTVSSLWPSAHGPGDPALDGTGFEPSGATGWFEAKGAAVPGELLSLTFALFDMGDTAYDSAVILDNFRWDCQGCSPSEVEPCVGIDPV